MPQTTRRGFLAAGGAALATLAGPRLSGVAFAGDAAGDAVLVSVFLSGGLDGLGLVAPMAGPDRALYEAARPTLAEPASALLPVDGRFGLHPAAAPLHRLFEDGRLAIVQAVGTARPYDSHAAATEALEVGSADGGLGWLARHLATAPGWPDEIYVPALALGEHQRSALRGSTESLHSAASGRLAADGPLWRPGQRQVMEQLYDGDSFLHRSGIQTLRALDIDGWLAGEAEYRPAAGATYPRGDFGTALARVAQMIRLDLGLRVAAVEMPGWDLHRAQAATFGDRVAELSAGLAAFDRDLRSMFGSRVTVLVHSELGRAVAENSRGGTDHGHASVALALGSGVVGGVHGHWPGLAPERRSGGGVAVTTDLRQLFGEVLVRRLGNPHLDQVLPGLGSYAPLGIVSGRDLELA